MGDANRRDTLQRCGLVCHHLGSRQQQPAAACARELPRWLQDPPQTVLVIGREDNWKGEPAKKSTLEQLEYMLVFNAWGRHNSAVHVLIFTGIGVEQTSRSSLQELQAEEQALFPPDSSPLGYCVRRCVVHSAGDVLQVSGKFSLPVSQSLPVRGQTSIADTVASINGDV